MFRSRDDEGEEEGGGRCDGGRGRKYKSAAAAVVEHLATCTVWSKWIVIRK